MNEIPHEITDKAEEILARHQALNVPYITSVMMAITTAQYAMAAELNALKRPYSPYWTGVAKVLSDKLQQSGFEQFELAYAVKLSGV